MENATKALLIAAAVLVAILIISLGLVVYQMASETIDSVNFSGQEVTAFNDQFLQYQGENKRGSEVNALRKTILQANMKSVSEGLSAADGAKFVKLDDQTGQGCTIEKSDTSLGTKAFNTSKLYKVSITYDSATGFVDTVTVQENDA